MFVFRLTVHTRATLAAIVAIAHLLVVTHATLVAHTLSASGAVVEHAAKSDDAHDHDATSWCRQGADRHLVADAMCGLSKTAQAARLNLKGLTLEAKLSTVARVPEGLRAQRSTVSVLTLSPKASPPALG